MRRARGMDDEALRVADVREVAPEIERGDEPLARLAAAFQVEHEDRARAFRQVPLDEGLVRTGIQTGIPQARDRGMTLEELRHADRVLDVLGHAQRKRFEAEQEQE